MRKAFLSPTLKMLRGGRLGWVANQAFKVSALKCGDGMIPTSRRAPLGPIMGIIAVTYRCNSRCQMCPVRNRGDKRSEMSTGDMERVIDQFAKIRTSGISFTGGEPLLRDDIFHLMSRVKARGIVTTLNTNGLLLDETNVERLLVAEPDNVNISIDGATDETNDEIRGVEGALRRVTGAVRLLSRRKRERRKRIGLTIVTVVSSKNIRELEQIADLSRRIGADRIGFIPQHSITSAPAPFDVTCRDEAAAHSVGGAFSRMRAQGIALDNSREYLDMFHHAFRGKKLPIKCGAGRASLVVDCYHNIFPCWPLVEAGRPIEGLKAMDIAEAWRSKEYECVRRWTESCRACFWNCHAELSILCRGIR